MFKDKLTMKSASNTKYFNSNAKLFLKFSTDAIMKYIKSNRHTLHHLIVNVKERSMYCKVMGIV